MQNEEVLGIVHNGKFHRLTPENKETKLSADPMYVGYETPEKDLTQYEGETVMVRGDDQGDWIYSVKVTKREPESMTKILGGVGQGIIDQEFTTDWRPETRGGERY